MTSDDDVVRAEHRKYLQQVHSDMQRDFDKLVTTIAAGGVALSLTFLRGTEPAEQRCLGILSAIAFVTSLVAVLASLWSSQQASAALIERLDDKQDKPSRKEKRWDWWVDVTNAVAVLTLGIGVVLLIIFVLVNL